jgi:hypothetical protein
MNSASWASYQSSLPIEARAGGEPDDDPSPVGRHDHEPARYVLVEWFGRFVRWTEEWSNYDPVTDSYITETVILEETIPVHRWFPAERWAWKHALAWQAAMKKRYGSATIEEVF